MPSRKTYHRVTDMIGSEKGTVTLLAILGISKSTRKQLQRRPERTRDQELWAQPNETLQHDSRRSLHSEVRPSLSGRTGQPSGRRRRLQLSSTLGRRDWRVSHHKWLGECGQ